MNEAEYKIWCFFCKELAKLNNILYAYDKIFSNIEIRKNRYNQFFQLILDSLTRNIAVTLDLFFQKRKNVWSLYKFDKISKIAINKIKKKAMPYIQLRHNKFAHLPDGKVYEDNFDFFTLKGIKEVKEIINMITEMLTKINTKEQYFFEWGRINDSIDRFFDDLGQKPVCRLMI